ncbi:hypothetical protein LEP1GSC132_3105 [Leptospira kirschneri str. 200803703]|uniref:Uncharacterized protein n=1 Tax=Leptospira kirschneri str. 200802841 TaxID=1193047 RepID=A0A828YAV5_9LEPT|nr:hypothetical protein LEP1GSC131_0480 [Leptospira kirschneri str. 200802841]EMO67354.1 hypothetical protein LEP1GSC132_3105 [Leptospira kirschneri str. 200803703]EMO74773.1 hypothetical protein LEP1GSC127_0045 [Leptospira kirschneri str. 200801925]
MRILWIELNILNHFPFRFLKKYYLKKESILIFKCDTLILFKSFFKIHS